MTTVAAPDDLLSGDPDVISRFLRESVRDDIHLAWIEGDRGACGGQWFGEDVDAAASWAAAHNAAGRNLYWTVNIVGPGLHKKPKKTDVRASRFVHVDIDPPKDGSFFDRRGVLAKLEILEPGFVIDSGGGLQAFWRLEHRCEDLSLIEGINLQVRYLFCADACHNIDRLMRVPGTVNWPDARKRERGRVPALASLVRMDTGETVRADQLRARFAAAPDANAGTSCSPASVLHELGVTAMCQPLHRLLTATDPARRSEEVLHAAGAMIRRGFEDATITRVLLDPALEISGHCLDQADPPRAAERAIACARKSSRREPLDSDQGQGVGLHDFWAYMPTGGFIFSPTGEFWASTSVNARIPPVRLSDPGGDLLNDEGGKPKTLKASAWLAAHRPVEQMTWAPGEPQIVRDRLISDGGWIERRNCSVFNLYRPPLPTAGDPTKAGPWLDHIRHIYPDDAEHIICWLAHRVQWPNEKINHALVLGGGQGIGKDTVLEPVKAAIGSWNFAEVSPQHMLGRFNGFVKSVILRVSEARDLGDVDRFSFYDHLKTYTAAPPDVLRVDEKHLREYSVFNVCGVIITTNHKTDGIYLPADDRRHYVAWSPRSREDFKSDYWGRLHGWYGAGGTGHVAAYLANLALDHFDAKAPPPKTAAFWDIVAANQAPEDAELADALEHLKTPDAVTKAMIIEVADFELQSWLRERRNSRSLPHRLEKCGYVAVRNAAATDGQFKVKGKRCTIYARKELTPRDQITAAEELMRTC